MPGSLPMLMPRLAPGLTGQRQVLELAYQPELASTPRLPAAGYPTAEALP